MSGVFRAVLLLATFALIADSHPLEGDVVVGVREKRDVNCESHFTQYDGYTYRQSCTSFCFVQGKYPYCYYGHCMCTSTPGQFPILPSHIPQEPATPPPTPSPKRSVKPWGDFGRGETCY